jgi:hypothetical protein
MISYQGSESSTSEGILKSFEKASSYGRGNAAVTPVLLLDEVGLAELSPHNPLKVRPVAGLMPIGALRAVPGHARHWV